MEETNGGGRGTGREAHRNSLPPLLFTQVCSASSLTRALTRIQTHRYIHVYARARARAFKLVAHGWYTFKHAPRSRSVVHTRIHSRTRTTPLECPHGPRSMPMHTHTDQKRIHVARDGYTCIYMPRTYTHLYTQHNTHDAHMYTRTHTEARSIGSIASPPSLSPVSPLSSEPSDQRRLSASLSSFSLFHSPPSLIPVASTPSLTYRTLLYV